MPGSAAEWGCRGQRLRRASRTQRTRRWRGAGRRVCLGSQSKAVGSRSRVPSALASRGAADGLGSRQSHAKSPWSQATPRSRCVRAGRRLGRSRPARRAAGRRVGAIGPLAFRNRDDSDTASPAPSERTNSRRIVLTPNVGSHRRRTRARGPTALMGCRTPTRPARCGAERADRRAPCVRARIREQGRALSARTVASERDLRLSAIRCATRRRPDQPRSR